MDSTHKSGGTPEAADPLVGQLQLMMDAMEKRMGERMTGVENKVNGGHKKPEDSINSLDKKLDAGLKTAFDTFKSLKKRVNQGEKELE